MEVSTNCMYNLTPIMYVLDTDFDTFKQKSFSHKEETYNIIRYNKERLTSDAYDTVGLFRSVIRKNGKIVCFSPPKSMNHVSFKENVDLSYAEEWELATRSSVGGHVSFFVDQENGSRKTFRQMFVEAVACNEDQNTEDKDFFTSVDMLPHDMCFSFILQHPENRIVTPFDRPNLYLVKAYKLSSDDVVKEVSLESVSSYLPKWVKYPTKVLYSNTEINNMLDRGYVTLPYTQVGVVLYGIHKDTGNVVRAKLRNTTYEHVRELRGNQPKLQYRYLMLRQEHKVTEYLRYYPEHKNLFQGYRNRIHTFTYTLYKQYVSCYIYRNKPLKLYSPQYRTHMYKLHELFCMDKTKVIDLTRVVDYVNKVHPTLLMHSLNYKYKTITNTD